MGQLMPLLMSLLRNWVHNEIFVPQIRSPGSWLHRRGHDDAVCTAATQTLPEKANARRLLAHSWGVPATLIGVSRRLQHRNVNSAKR